MEPIAAKVWKAAAPRRRRNPLVLRTATLVAVALLVPAVGRSDAAREQPRPPTSLRVISSSPTSLTLTWNADARGLGDRYDVYKDGAEAGSTPRTTFVFGGLSCGTAYALAVEAIDAAGRRSERASVTSASDPCVERPPPPRAEAPALPQQSSPITPPVFRPATSPQRPVMLPHEVGASAGMPWAGAGAFVWHETDVAPEALGAQLRESGFAWVAVLIHEGVEADPIEGDWVRRFREASQLLVGGWGVLRTEPEREADLAHRLLADNSLDFYIANPEAEYKLSDDDGPSEERYGRSQRFVEAFRALEPETPAAMSSYCRADMQDIDWEAWDRSGFVFLPQAYVNDFGAAASPASCAEGASEFFPAAAVHPTVGVYTGQEGEPSPERYAALLDEAGTVGFSVYLAETRMQSDEWRSFGAAIDELAIARTRGVSSMTRRKLVARDELRSAE